MTYIVARKCRKKYTMTLRSFYEAVASANINDEMTLKAQELIATLDKHNASRKGKPTKANLEAAARRDAIFAVVTSEPMTRDQIAELANVTPAQATSALTFLAKDGKVTVSKAKIDKATKSVYTLA